MTHAAPTVTTLFIGPKDQSYWVFDGTEREDALWVEAYLPRRQCESDEARQHAIRDLWAATEQAHPVVAEVKNKDRLVRERVLALMKARKAAPSG